MDFRWNLDQLYTSFDSEKFQKDLEATGDLVDKINNWANENLDTQDNPVAKMEKFVEFTNEFLDIHGLLIRYCMLIVSADSKNKDGYRYLEKLNKAKADLTPAQVRFEKWVGNLESLEELISKSEYLEEHSLFLFELTKDSQYLLSDEEEVLYAKLTNTGSKAWSKLQNTVTSNLMVDITIDGEEKQLPLPEVRNMAYNGDQDLRKKAYQAELDAYSKIEETSAACLNGIKGEVLTMVDLKGYESPLEEILIKQRMERETLDAMLTAMKESLPTFHKYYRKKAELLGHDDGLPFYDLFAPIGEVDMEYTYQEARDYIVDNFVSFSQELSDFVSDAFENQWIDAKPRQGKRGGAFCMNLRSIKESRILTNFNGSFSNMTTLAHELGHAFHGYCLNDESFINCRYPMPLAETASIFNETIVTNSALENSNEKEAFSILESTISGAGQVIVDIYSRFLFESELFERRKDHSLSVDELKEIMIDAQKEAYGEGLDHDCLHPYMWLNKTHYYSAERNFYNYPYAFGLLFAKGLYAEYQKRGDEFVEDYKKLLQATGKKTIADVAKMADIDVNSVDFWRSSLEVIKEDIDKFIELADNLK